MLELIKILIRKDKHWIPKEPGHSLYVRPTLSELVIFYDILCSLLTLFLVGTQRAIGVGPPNEALLFVICSPVGPYYPQGFKPVALYGTTEYIRAAPGGMFASDRIINSSYRRSRRHWWLQAWCQLRARRRPSEGGCSEGLRPESLVTWSGALSHRGKYSLQIIQRKRYI